MSRDRPRPEEFSPVLAGATARRVLTQLRHDPRTIAMMVAVPAVMMFVIMFIVAAITTQRERSTGTLERLMAMPLGQVDLLTGYGIAFALMACVQVAVVLVVSLTWLGVTVPGSALPLAVIAVLDAILGMACGLFASAFARTEFQAVQFMPAFVLPQALLSGLVVPREHMVTVLRWLSDILPLSYAVDAMQRITAGTSWTRAGAAVSR